jgi:hypothetical protein
MERWLELIAAMSERGGISGGSIVLSSGEQWREVLLVITVLLLKR